jgi:chaperonin cofactor prefoldin
MRAFIKLKELSTSQKDIYQKLETLERRYRSHNHKFKQVFEAIRQLLQAPAKPKLLPIPKVKGFISNN